MLNFLKNKHLLTEEKVELFDKEKEYIDLNILKEILIKDKLQGNIILYGLIDDDKNRILDFIRNRCFNKSLKTLEHYINEDVLYNENELRKHEIIFGKTKDGMSGKSNQTEIKCQSDMNKLLKINNEGYNAICYMHIYNKIDVYKKLESWGCVKLDINYLIDVSFIKNKQRITIYNLIKNEIYTLFENKIYDCYVYEKKD